MYGSEARNDSSVATGTTLASDPMSCIATTSTTSNAGFVIAVLLSRTGSGVPIMAAGGSRRPCDLPPFTR
ncbi:hypothetical protein Cma02nite_31230 [Cellulomonas marina]|nr:hypothetical protein Cma02nite_31230 [Cellulomonas marina]